MRQPRPAGLAGPCGGGDEPPLTRRPLPRDSGACEDDGGDQDSAGSDVALSCQRTAARLPIVRAGVAQATWALVAGQCEETLSVPGPDPNTYSKAQSPHGLAQTPYSALVSQLSASLFLASVMVVSLCAVAGELSVDHRVRPLTFAPPVLAQVCFVLHPGPRGELG